MSLPLPHTHTPYYPPFGSSLPNRTWSDGNRGYRFGFNGKEKDSETASDNFDFGARIYDGRLGRWLSLDPLMKKYVSFSAFNFGLNNPIYFLDPDGKQIVNPYDKSKKEELDAWIKVQTAIEMVKLIHPELYNKLESSTYILKVQIKNLSEYVEPTVSDGFSGTTTFSNSNEQSTDQIGECIFVPPSPINKATGDVIRKYSEEEGLNNFYKKSIRKDESGYNMKAPDPNDPTKEIYIYDEEIITEQQANDLLKLKNEFEINIDDGVSSAYLLGRIFSHELEHANFAISNKAITYIQKDLPNDEQDDEISATNAEKTYNKNHNNDLETQAQKNVKEKQEK